MSANDNASLGFPPIAAADARVLILGSLPSRASLRASQYYAHPQNAFWKVMRELAGAEGPYETRCEALMNAGIAVWDVLACSERPGSMDAAIRVDTAKSNDFGEFFRTHELVRLVGFNGRKAEQLFHRLVLPRPSDSLAFALLPSTSPAYAALSPAKKIAAWRGTIGPYLDIMN